MPGIPLICETEADLPEDQDGPNSILNLTALKIKLLHPSTLDSSTRLQCCSSSLILTEIYLHFGVAEDAMRDFRKFLTVRKYLVKITRSSRFLGQVKGKILMQGQSS